MDPSFSVHSLLAFQNVKDWYLTEHKQEANVIRDQAKGIPRMFKTKMSVEMPREMGGMVFVKPHWETQDFPNKMSGTENIAQRCFISAN